MWRLQRSQTSNLTTDGFCPYYVSPSATPEWRLQTFPEVLTASLDTFCFFIPAKKRFVFPKDLCKLVTNLDTCSSGKSQVM